MFGYVNIHKPECKFREYDQYKAVYCSLCHTLKRQYGFLARYFLSYDMTFLVLFRLNFGTEYKLCRKRCPYKLWKNCTVVAGEEDAFSFGAAATVLAVYEKLMDDLQDEGFGRRLRARILLMFARRWKKRAELKFPQVADILHLVTQQQTYAETHGNKSLDSNADASAQGLSRLLVYGQNEQVSRVLKTIGYHVGKWVYLLDALDDYTNDCKKHRFNPYALRMPNAELSEICDFSQKQMYICIDQACLAFELLPSGPYTSILYNILYCGLEARQLQVVRRLTHHE